MSRFWLVLAALSGALAVAVAAWSTHGLPALLAPELLPHALESARTASHYHLVHSLALLAVGLWLRLGGGRWLHAAAALFVLGMLCFSGGIYLRLITGVAELVWVVPVGGTAFIAGWLALAVAGWRHRA